MARGAPNVLQTAALTLLPSNCVTSALYYLPFDQDSPQVEVPVKFERAELVMVIIMFKLLGLAVEV